MEAHFQSLNMFRQSSRRRLTVRVGSILRWKKICVGYKIGRV